jgi:hypothetical protein
MIVARVVIGVIAILLNAGVASSYREELTLTDSEELKLAEEVVEEARIAEELKLAEAASAGAGAIIATLAYILFPSTATTQRSNNFNGRSPSPQPNEMFSLKQHRRNMLTITKRIFVENVHPTLKQIMFSEGTMDEEKTILSKIQGSVSGSWADSSWVSGYWKNSYLETKYPSLRCGSVDTGTTAI